MQLTVADGRTCRARTFDISEGGLGLVGVPAEWADRQHGARSASKAARSVGGSSREGTIVSRRGEKAGVQFTSLDAGSAPAVADYVARGRNRDDEIDEAEADARRR